MTIEQDINQPVFRNEYQKAMINLLFTHGWVTDKTKLIFEKEDITPQQFNILRILRGANAPLTTLQIRERMLDKMSDTSRIVDRLIIKEFAKKVTSTTDKRLVDISITEKGKRLLKKLDKFEDEFDAVMGKLTLTDAKLLNSLLDKIRQAN